jgi:hypothetical protein
MKLRSGKNTNQVATATATNLQQSHKYNTRSKKNTVLENTNSEVIIENFHKYPPFRKMTHPTKPPVSNKNTVLEDTNSEVIIENFHKYPPFRKNASKSVSEITIQTTHKYNTRSKKNTVKPVSTTRPSNEKASHNGKSKSKHGIHHTYPIVNKLTLQNQVFSYYFRYAVTVNNPGLDVLSLNSDLMKNIGTKHTTRCLDKNGKEKTGKLSQNRKDQLLLNPFEFFYIPIDTMSKLTVTLKQMLNKLSVIKNETLEDWPGIISINPTESFEIMRFIKLLTYVNFLFTQLLFNNDNIKKIYSTGVYNTNDRDRLMKTVVKKIYDIREQLHIIYSGLNNNNKTVTMGQDMKLLVEQTFAGLINMEDKFKGENIM